MTPGVKFFLLCLNIILITGQNPNPDDYLYEYEESNSLTTNSTTTTTPTTTTITTPTTTTATTTTETTTETTTKETTEWVEKIQNPMTKNISSEAEVTMITTTGNN